MRTRVFNITYYEKDKLLYIRFLGCNMSCIICVNKISIYDTHLPDSVLKLLEMRKPRPLSLDELKSIIRGVQSAFDVDCAVLGGGEPTVDPALSDVVKVLKGCDIRVRLLTNGLFLDDCYLKRLRDSGLDSDDKIVISVKSVDPGKHLVITGVDNSRVLDNIVRAYRKGFSVSVETVHVPELNDADDIERLARWMRESLGEDVELIIDPYVPVPGLRYGSPSLDERLRVCERARAWVKNVRYRLLRQSGTGGGHVICRGVMIGYSHRLSGNLHLVYPEVEAIA